jgi:A/G-specific adenine glycosylase
MKPLAPAAIRSFRKKIYDHYRQYGRDLPWRRTKNPYHVLVSEIMLQQTQVERVMGTYEAFITAFPDFASLAGAPLPKLLRLWQGMGYNRRALALRALAQEVAVGHDWKLPSDPDMLMSLPGVGQYTAGAVAAFAFNKPVVCIDTNIRRVYLHEFFPGREKVPDADIVPLVSQTLDMHNPRKWYNALMDYGSMLKREQGNPNKRSAHYVRQSPFENSNRQVRGRILKALVAGEAVTAARLVKETGMDAVRVKKNLADLEKEGFIRKEGRYYTLS